jgi:hypothetical protein
MNAHSPAVAEIMWPRPGDGVNYASYTEASWTGMLIDWEGAGSERRFEIRVPNVLEAGKFYRDVFGARETFRQETHNGEVFRLGFAIGRIGFAISSEGDIEQERPVLSSGFVLRTPRNDDGRKFTTPS